ARGLKPNFGLTGPIFGSTLRSMHPIFLRRALLVAMMISAGCSSLDYSSAPQSGRVLAHVVWTDNPAKDCHGNYGGCAYAMNGVCTILAPRPRSFDDHDRIETVGHELL